MTFAANLPSFLTGRPVQASGQATAVSRFPALFANWSGAPAVASAAVQAPRPVMGRDVANFSPLPMPSPLAPVAPPPPPPAPLPPPPPPPAPLAPFANLLGRQAWVIPAAPSPAAAPAGPVDGQAPDPKVLRAAILAYRKDLLEMDQRSRGYGGMIFSGLTGGGATRPVMLLQGPMLPHTYKLTCLAWLGREATPAEIQRWDAAILADPRNGLQAMITEVRNRGLLARLDRTDRSPAALEAIERQVAQMLVWQPGDMLGTDDALVPPIPPGPALDPVRSSAPVVVGTPIGDRARSAEASVALRAAIAGYGVEVAKGSELTMILSGQLSNNKVFFLPGLMLPHCASIFMLAWIGRSPSAAETAKWTAWQAGEGGRNARTAFGDIVADIERIALAERLPETNGSSAALQAMRAEMAARLTWY